MDVAFINLDDDNKVTGTQSFDNIADLQTFLSLVNEYGVDNDDTHVECYIKFNPIINRFEIQYEE